IDSPESPISYMVDQLKIFPLIPGSGEFGGGCGIPGEYINVIQSNLIRMALISVSRMYLRLSDIGKADELKHCSEEISKNMMKYLVSENGVWTWCIRPDTMMIDDAVMNHPVNKGSSCINGVLAMCADVYGYDLKTMDWEGMPVGVGTFDTLLSDPFRADLFDKHGGWMQFGTFYENMLGGPSYGQGYATQVMLLLDRMDLAEKSLRFIAQSTVNPPRSLKLNRESKYWLYERYYSPDLDDTVRKKEGCGALNLVCVAEPLKIARMMVGVDDLSGDTVLVIPRIPASWSGFSVQDWPIWTGENVVRCNISYGREDCHEHFSLVVLDEGKIPKLMVRLGGQFVEFENVHEVSAGT
ncbi:MAG: hypothetical protein SCM11_20785, partial [Bacillota bacterium]|nr:hypothetical protein [Bacillota bacterium]